MRLRKMIKVMIAAALGAPIQSRSRDPEGAWLDCPDPEWNWGFYTYRVKR